MVFIQSKWSWLNIFAIIISIMSWFAIAFGVSMYLPIDFDWFYLYNRIMTDRTFWITMILVLVAVSVKDLTLLLFKKLFWYTPEDIIREVIFYHFSIFSFFDLLIKFSFVFLFLFLDAKQGAQK